MKAIVAVDKNWGIGCKGCLLVDLPPDLKHFKDLTMGKVVIMGRGTYESLPEQKPLPGRTNIILSRNKELEVEGFTVCHSTREFFETLHLHREREIFVIGGEGVYLILLPFCTEIFVTKIDHEYVADKYFPNLDEKPEWYVAEESAQMEDNGTRYRFVTYRRENK